MMAGRGKSNTCKVGRNKPRLSPEPELQQQQDANETLLLNMRQMMEEMRSISKFDSIILEAVKKEITVALDPFETEIVSHGKTIADLERLANDHDSKLTDF